MKLALANDTNTSAMAGGTWKAKKIARKSKGSQTPGKSKGENCHTDAAKQFFAKRSRSYKDRGYPDWCRKMTALNNATKSGLGAK
jgi:hypothetical protein